PPVIPPVRHRPLVHLVLLSRAAVPRLLPPFPTRRSSDLLARASDPDRRPVPRRRRGRCDPARDRRAPGDALGPTGDRRESRRRVDRKSTRLNSSHLGISYAVFCLKKKKPTVEKQASVTLR